MGLLASESTRLRVAITGATGMVGTALAEALHAGGHEVIAISRKSDTGALCWDPAARQFDPRPLNGIDAVVHLAGANLADGRWTEERKSDLRESRVPVTGWLASMLAGLPVPPRVLVSASAVGIYGDCGDEWLDESATPGSDFLARLAADWEAAADPARQAGIRVVHPRFGVILSAAGGALEKMLTPFKLGLGGPIGSGEQWMSWIAIDDIVRAIIHVIAVDHLAGPVNFTAPAPSRNAAFVAALGRALHRPAIVPLPAFALRIAFGEMADATILASQRVSSARLEAGGFEFRFAALDKALAHALRARR